MPDDTDMTDWQPGQQPPWLDAYGPPPFDSAAVGGPDVLAQPESAPPSETPQPSTTAPVQLPQFIPPWLQQPQEAPPAPPQPEVPTADATSGAAPEVKGETADQAIQRWVLDPNAPIAQRQQAWQMLSPAERTSLVNNADPKQAAAAATSAMSPEELATITLRHQQTQIHEQSAQQLELMRQRDIQARQAWEAQQAVYAKAAADTAQVDADAKQLSQTKIDPKEHGVLHFIGSVLTGALGGAFSKYTGGRNLALEELDKQTQNRIEAQKADLENQWKGIGMRRNMIAERLQIHGDMYRAETEYRVAQYDRAVSELQTQMQDYDPQGTTALRAATMIQQIQGQRAKALMDFNQQQQKNALEQYKAKGAYEKDIAAAAKDRAEASKAYIEAQQQKIGSQVFQPKELQALHPGLPTPPIAMSLKDYGGWLERQQKGTELGKTATEAAGALNAGLIRNPVTKKPLPDPSDPSKPLVFPVTQATENNDQIAATQSAIDNLSKARRALKADPSTIDRKEWARIQSDIAQSFPALATIYGEKYSARTEEALKDVLNLDYDSYRKRVTDMGIGMATIDNTIDTLVRNGNTKIGTKLGYDADKNPLFVDTSRPADAVDTPDESRLRDLLSGKGLISIVNGKETDVNDAGMRKLYALVSDAQYAADPKAREVAGNQLLDVAQNSTSPAIREAAGAELQRLATTDLPVTPPATGPQTSTSNVPRIDYGY